MYPIQSSLFQLPIRGACQALGDLAMRSAHDFGRRINSVINVERAIIVTALALSSLALIASLFSGSFLAISLSAGLIVLLAYSAKLHEALTTQKVLNVRLQNHLTDEARLSEARGSQIAELGKTNEEFKKRLQEVMPLVEVTRETLSTTKVSIDELLAAVTATREAEHDEGEGVIKALQAQKATVELQIAVVDKLSGEMAVHGSHVGRIAQDILNMMRDFSTDQKTALLGFFEESRALKEEIARHREQIEAQLAELKAIQRQIAESAITLAGHCTQLARCQVSPFAVPAGEGGIEISVRA